MSQAFQSAIGRISRNRLLNPDSSISQASGNSVVTASGYTVDRWQVIQPVANTLSSQQVVGGAFGPLQPTNYSHVINVVTSSTPAAGDQYARFQNIEGTRMRDLQWGTANARPMAYTIGVYANTAGVYSIAFNNGALNRSYVTTITIVNAGVVEFHTVVVPGDTTGTWATDTTTHTQVAFSLGMGSTYTTSTINQWQAGNFYKATGSIDFVSLATNSVMYFVWDQYERDFATAPEVISQSDMLLACQRYYWKRAPVTTKISVTGSTSGFSGSFVLPVPMRASPTITSNATSAQYQAIVNPSGLHWSLSSFDGGAATITGTWTGTPAINIIPDATSNQTLLLYGYGPTLSLAPNCLTLAGPISITASAEL